MPSSQGSSQPGIEHRSLTLQADSLLSEAQAKPMNTGVDIPSPGNLPSTGIKSGSPALQADSLPAELPGKPYHSSLARANFMTSTKSKRTYKCVAKLRTEACHRYL